MGFVPTSMTAAPGFTQSAFTISGFPMAAIRMSASAQMACASFVLECTTVTVASSSCSTPSECHGLSAITFESNPNSSMALRASALAGRMNYERVGSP